MFSASKIAVALLAVALASPALGARDQTLGYGQIGLGGGTAVDENETTWATVAVRAGVGFAAVEGWRLGVTLESRDFHCNLDHKEDFNAFSLGGEVGHDWKHVGVYGRFGIGSLTRLHESAENPPEAAKATVGSEQGLSAQR